MKSSTKKFLIYSIIAIILILIFINIFGDKKPEKGTTEKPPADDKNTQKQEEVIDLSSTDFQKYNYRYVDEEVNSILTKMIGTSGKTAFYIPEINYVNISKEQVYGIAFALNNPNPSGENYFEYTFMPGEQTLTNCKVDQETALTWINSGQSSFGKIPKGWVDHMTVSFKFPTQAPNCQAIYNFQITKDGQTYDEREIIINIIN